MKTYAFIIKRNQNYPAGYANGYVAVDNTHPLFGKSYSDTVEVPDIESLSYNGNVFGLFIHSFKEKKENEISLDLAINVHCGLTFSNELKRLLPQKIEWLDEIPFNTSDLWVFGFDTAHCDDDLQSWPREACIAETIKLQEILENWK